MHAEDGADVAAGRSPRAEVVAVRKILEQTRSAIVGEVRPRLHERGARRPSWPRRALAQGLADRGGAPPPLHGPTNIAEDAHRESRRRSTLAQVAHRTHRDEADAQGEAVRLLRHRSRAAHRRGEASKGAPGFPGLEFALPLFLTKTEDIATPLQDVLRSAGGLPRHQEGEDLPWIPRRPGRPARRGAGRSTLRSSSRRGGSRRSQANGCAYAVDHVFKRGSTVYQDGRFRKHPALPCRAESVGFNSPGSPAEAG